MLRRLIPVSVVVISLAFLPLLASAQILPFGHPKPNVFDGGNRWTVTCYNDPSSAHTTQATQGICFFPYAVLGQGIAGIWYSDTFPDWNGRYYQEGDQVRMHGDYADNNGHDGFEWDVVSAKTGAGHWTEWREDLRAGTTITFCNANWTRVGSCPNTPSLPYKPEYDTLMTALSDRVPLRCTTDGKEAPDPITLLRQVECQ
jgi:hypothetical protein